MTPAEIEKLADKATCAIHGDDYRIATRLVIELIIKDAITAQQGVEAMIEELAQCSNYDSNTKKPWGLGKWRTVNIPIDLWNRIRSQFTKAAAQADTPSRHE